MMASEISEDVVDKYLQENADFLKNWLAKHGNKDMLESVKMETPDRERTHSVMSKTSPGIYGLKSTNMFKNYVESLRFQKKQIDRETLTKMTEKDMFMELIRDISSELNVNVLCHKILQNVSILTKCDRGSLFLVRGTKDSKILVSKLFDVTETSTLEESVHTEETEIKVPFGKGIAGHVALTKETINIREAYEDPRFNQDVDRLTGYRTHSILSMPILNRAGETIGVAQIINKVCGDHEFTTQDEEVFQNYLTFCGIGLVNAQLFEMSVMEYKRNQMLLNLARGIFEEQSNLEKLIQKIMVDAQDLLKCERCSVYLLDESKNSLQEEIGISTKNDETVSFSKVFDLYAKAKGTIHVPSAAEIAKSKEAEMAKYVVLKGMSINIGDLVLDGRFGPGPFINSDGFQSVSMLCMPIFNNEKKIIGICQLINKLNCQPFNENDINIIEAFSIFCGLGIHNCQMYENACKLMAKQSVALEVLSYHACAQPDEVDKLMVLPTPDAQAIQLYSFDFDDECMTDDDTVITVMSMFMEADLLEQYHVPKNVLLRWALSVKKNYRPVIYHNWRHAFNVTQSMFCMLMTGGIRKYLDGLELLTLLAACLCHDLDHRGTNNAFQVKAESPLAMLYGTSTMEHHHFDHCVMILNSEGNNIFANLSSADYRRVIKMLESAILSTDLALYFKKRGNFKELIDKGDVSFDETEKKELLKAMMMTACDVAAICKPWEIQQRVANLVASEFFDQGDMEKERLNQTPVAMMDREKSDDLPKMQVGFINAICLPVYQLFSIVSPECSPLFEGCLNNRNCWQKLVIQNESQDIKTSPAEEKKPDSAASSPAVKSSTAVPPASQKSTVTSTITTKVTVTTQKRVKGESNGTTSKLTKTPAVQKPPGQANNPLKSHKKILQIDPKSRLCLLQ